MSYDGVKLFKLFNGRLNAQAYQEILENYLMPSIDLMDDKDNVIFQQDNAPCHTAHKIRDFFIKTTSTLCDGHPIAQISTALKTFGLGLITTCQKFKLEA